MLNYHILKFSPVASKCVDGPLSLIQILSWCERFTCSPTLPHYQWSGKEMELGMIYDVWWRGVSGALLEMNVPRVRYIDWLAIL